MIGTRLFKALVVALACAACHVGEPLVDEYEAGPGTPWLMCNLPPRCLSLTPGETPLHPAVPVDVACDQACVWETSNGESDDCPSGPLEQLPRSAHCMHLQLQPPAATPELKVKEVAWQDVNVIVSVEKPIEIVFHKGSLQRVFIELQGPITLRMEDLEQFDDLRILGSSTNHGAPNVEIAAERGTGLSVNSLNVPFPGEIKLRAGIYADIDASAQSLTFESAFIEQARLQAETTKLTDITLQYVVVDTKHALWSVFVATDAGLRFCGDARLIAGQMARCAIAACEGSSLRMFNSSFASGSLDGTFELSDANLENVQLATQAATSVLAYGSSISSTQLCEHMELLALGEGSQIKCSGCVDALLENLPVCALEEPTEKWLKNYCTGWSADDPLPLCADDIPQRANRAR